MNQTEDCNSRQRNDAIMIATEYLKKTSPQKVCDFLNSGKLDINSEG